MFPIELTRPDNLRQVYTLEAARGEHHLGWRSALCSLTKPPEKRHGENL
jgi:hypothetical protein